MAIDGFRINLGAAERRTDLSTLVTKEHFESLLAEAKADPRFKDQADRYEFRLRRLGGEAVLELKQQNIGSKFTFFGGARRSAERQKAIDAFTRLYPDLPLNVQGGAVRRNEARILQGEMIQGMGVVADQLNPPQVEVDRSSNVSRHQDNVPDHAVLAPNDARVSIVRDDRPILHEMRGAIETLERAKELVELIPEAPAERRAAFLRANSEMVNALIQFTRLKGGEPNRDPIFNRIDAIKRDYMADPRLAAVKAYIDDVVLYGEDVPYHFLISAEGTIAALEADSYDKAVNLDANAKCAENSILFVDADQEQGGTKAGDTGLNYFTVLNNRDVAPRLLNQFPVLTASMGADKSPAQDISANVFGDDPAVKGWFKNAFQGTAKPLTLDEGTMLASQFDQKAPTVISGGNWHFFANDRNRWDQARLADGHFNLMKEGAARAGVAPNDKRALGHFLFGLSATFTRLSSDKVFGNDGASIPSLRFYGYTLFKEAQRQAPELLPGAIWVDIENRFLNRNNAFDCAAILSGMQFEKSKAINADEYSRFVPKIFQSAADEQQPIQVIGLENVDDDEAVDIDDIMRIQEERARAESIVEI